MELLRAPYGLLQFISGLKKQRGHTGKYILLVPSRNLLPMACVMELNTTLFVRRSIENTMVSSIF
jgi:hypothetical protein